MAIKKIVVIIVIVIAAVVAGGMLWSQKLRPTDPEAIRAACWEQFKASRTASISNFTANPEAGLDRNSLGQNESSFEACQRDKGLKGDEVQNGNYYMITHEFSCTTDECRKAI